MQILKVNNYNASDVAQVAAETLSTGGLLVYPTDTAYGLGARADSETAIKKLYQVKKRSFNKPTHVIVRDWEMIEKLCYTNRKAKIAFKKFLPGPLTIILRKRKIVPNILVANYDTVGVRIPNNTITLAISSLVSFPYTTPSANITNKPTPYSIKEVKSSLGFDHVDLIVDAGILKRNPPSTIVNLSNNRLEVIRHGPIEREVLEKSLN